jgi:hypothetical protein
LGGRLGALGRARKNGASRSGPNRSLAVAYLAAWRSGLDTAAAPAPEYQEVVIADAIGAI